MQTATRRGFLSFLGAAVAGATLDPERLLWKPRAKLISIPKPKFLGPVYKRGDWHDGGITIRYHYDSLRGTAQMDVVYGFPQYAEYSAMAVSG